MDVNKMEHLKKPELKKRIILYREKLQEVMRKEKKYDEHQ